MALSTKGVGEVHSAASAVSPDEATSVGTGSSDSASCDSSPPPCRGAQDAGGERAKEGREKQDDAGHRGCRVPLQDSSAYPEGAFSWDLPVRGARLYNSSVRPVALPSGRVKMLVLPVFWAVCVGWHLLQRRAQLAWQIPGEPGETVQLQRSLPGAWQVLLNAVCVVTLSAYAVAAYLFHERILNSILNPLFIPSSWLSHYFMSLLMFAVAIVSSFFLTENWVAASAGLFMFFAYAVVARTVQPSCSHSSQIGLGPSRADDDAGSSFHAASASAETGYGASGRGVVAVLLSGQAGEGNEGGSLHFASIRQDSPGVNPVGDDAALVEKLQDGSCVYRGPCGRAVIFRLDCLLVLAASFGGRLPWFVLGSGGYNQCAGLVELLVSMLYIPIGYTCFAVFGFRVGMANRWSMAVVLVLCLWPFINLCLGGKGCGTLTALVAGEYLPQIWDPAATTISFSRGFASCSESAYALGGEALLVASTTIAAWVHVMSNFSFLFGFVSGMVRSRGRKATEESVVVR
eukprot:CAMPEP_0198606896 /NCGR_PEP_ID=MMETSP1462-20131121/155125_1 /TAXON_ID=1333877 /ORGANISM="Brandtodinium nutriculum, Strain RCC3387" /LENGTH=516 /DNA_ID=CAMNT_0044338701 /DNA_START=48 /DNA_END=1598 /DNA_ORIENTATION=+